MEQTSQYQQLYHFLTWSLNDTNKKLQKLHDRVDALDQSLNDRPLSSKERKRIRFARGKIVREIRNGNQNLLAINQALKDTEYRMRIVQSPEWMEYLPPVLRFPPSPSCVPSIYPQFGSYLPYMAPVVSTWPMSPCFPVHAYSPPIVSPHFLANAVPSHPVSTTGSWTNLDSSGWISPVSLAGESTPSVQWLQPPHHRWPNFMAISNAQVADFSLGYAGLSEENGHASDERRNEMQGALGNGDIQDGRLEDPNREDLDMKASESSPHGQSVSDQNEES